MLFLIDYENVGNIGMKGHEYLDAGDYVVLFYSEAKKNMERRALEDITSSGCRLEIYKLCKTGKNALDFYIASRLGELVGGGYEGIAVIVSNDAGFQAVRDYWGSRAPHKRRVLLSPCLEAGIVSGNENNQRTRELRQKRESLSIGKYYDTYQERMRIRAVLKELFAGTPYEAMTEKIQNIIENKDNTAKITYLSSLHLFGKEDGLKIYHKIKACKELRQPWQGARNEN